METEFIISFILIGLSLLLLGFFLVLIIRSSIKREGRLGLNFKPVYCPSCGTKAPQVRKPATMQEAFWGGWTCKQCQCKMDKWGKAIKAPSQS